MIVIRTVLLILIAASGAAVVGTRDPVRQSMVVSAFGLLLALYFTATGAMDVALSEIVIGAVGLPSMILLAAARMRRLK